MPTSFTVWVVTRCQARGIRCVWDYLDDFPSHRTGRVHQNGRPGLLVAIPCPRPGCEVCMEPGGAGDLALERDAGGVQFLALTPVGLETLLQLAGSAQEPAVSAAARAGSPSPGIDQVRQLAAEGRLISLPGHGDPPVIREVMSHQEFYVLEASIIGNGLCTQCRMCEAVCLPRALSLTGDGRVRMTGDCFFGACGLCYIACPQLYWQQWAVRHTDEEPRPAAALGGWRLPAVTIEEALEELRCRCAQRPGDLRWVRLTDGLRPGALAREAIALRQEAA